METPGEGLQALASALAADGVLHGLVYAANRRAGVYLLQDAFRRLDLRQNSQDIKVARDIVAALPEHHYFHWLRRGDAGNEIADDAAFVDLMLRPRDRAYSVPEVVALIEGAGLGFQGWEDNRFYYADTHFGSESRIAQMPRQLPQANQWAVVDNLVLQAMHHAFLACQRGRLAQRWPEFESDALLDTFPVRRPDLQLTGEGTDYVLSRRSVRVRLTEAGSFLIRMAGRDDGPCARSSRIKRGRTIRSRCASSTSSGKAAGACGSGDTSSSHASGVRAHEQRSAQV